MTGVWRPGPEAGDRDRRPVVQIRDRARRDDLLKHTKKRQLVKHIQRKRRRPTRSSLQGSVSALFRGRNDTRGETLLDD